MPRAIWKGAITFGLVHVPVALYPASQESDIDFDWIDARTHDPVGYKRINKRTGREITKEHIVKGIQHTNGEYVLLSEDEIKAAFPKSTQTIEIESFVDGKEIPLVFFERPYHLAPVAKGEKVYALLREAMLASEVVGIARVVLHTKEHLAALVPTEEVLILNTLRWASEIRSTDGLSLPAAGKSAARLEPNELKVAGQLIRHLTADWKPEQYEDTFTASIRELVARKAKAGETEAGRGSLCPVAAPRAEDGAAKTRLTRAAALAMPRNRPAGPSRARGALPATLEGARRAALPTKLGPQLATLSKTLPEGGEWLYEIKFDGYRILTRIREGRVRLLTRRGHDWTARMAPLARALEGLGLRSAWLDGEIVVLDEDGVPSFNALQNAFDSARTDTIRYFLFDVPHLEGYDLRAVPLRARRAALERLLEGNASDELRFSAALPGDAESVLHSACQLGLEGILAKRADAPYVSARTTTWLKLKCTEQQEFVIGGYTDRTGSTAEIGSLLLGVHRDDGRLAFAGAVGTGWSSKTASELKRRLREIEIPSPPFAADAPARRGRWTKRSGGAKHWVEPRLIAQVTFTEWTADGLIRHASFQGLREDKPAEAVVREAPARFAPAPKARRPPDAVAGRKISNPDRVIDPSTGLRKLDLVRYYAGVADWILPHLVGRPVTLVRGPTGIEGELFFQKHDEKLTLPGIRTLAPEFLPDPQPLLEIRDVEGLIGAAQMNTIELHTWNSTTRSIDRPDRMIFDLDPGQDVAWQRMQEAALLVRTMLAEIGIESWLKTSGGKGLHVVVPLVPRLDYDAVKAFSKTVVEHLARTLPSHFVAVAGPKNRIGRIYVDYVRNGLGATTAAACSARARPGLGVSMPVSWEELPSLTSGDQWSIATALEHLSARGVDPWQAYWTTRQTLTRAQKAMKGSRPRA